MNILLHAGLNRMNCVAIEEILKDYKSKNNVLISHKQEPCDFNSEIKPQNHYNMLVFRKHRFREIPGFYGYPPVDDDLMKSIAPYEGEIYKMMDAYYPVVDTFDERQRIFLDALRLFNGIILKNEIQLLINFGIPHQIYDFIIYVLCKTKGIKTLLLYRSPIIGYIYLFEDINEHDSKMRGNYGLQLDYFKDRNELEVPLSNDFEEMYINQTKSKNVAELYYMSNRSMTKQIKLYGERLKLLFKYERPFYNIQQFISGLIRKNKINAIIKDHASEPDLNKKYFYIALHYQPEGTTSPMAGIYANQILIIQMMSYSVPKDVLIYVKEHPSQRLRGKKGLDFYKQLSEMRNVRLVPTEYSTSDLINNCVGVGTATGTIAFESLFKGKPTIMFGHNITEYAPNVIQVKTLDDCRNAINQIMANKFDFNNKLHARVYLKVLSEKLINAEFASNIALANEHGKLTSGVSNINIYNAIKEFIEEKLC